MEGCSSGEGVSVLPEIVIWGRSLVLGEESLLSLSSLSRKGQLSALSTGSLRQDTIKGSQAAVPQRRVHAESVEIGGTPAPPGNPHLSNLHRAEEEEAGA